MKRSKASTNKYMNAPGYIYFFRTKKMMAGAGVKIGFSTNPISRCKAHSSEVGVPLKLLSAVRGTRRHEQALHRILHHYRLHGEWFSTRNPSVTNFIYGIYHKKKLPKNLLSNQRHLAEALGNYDEYCACGRVIIRRKDAE